MRKFHCLIDVRTGQLFKHVTLCERLYITHFMYTCKKLLLNSQNAVAIVTEIQKKATEDDHGNVRISCSNNRFFRQRSGYY